VRKAGAKKRIVRLARAQRVDDILAAALQVFSEKGYENTAVSEIAARIGVVEGTVYKYFESKRELLLKVLENWYEQMFGDYSKDLAGIVGTRQRLRFLVWRHLRTVRDQPLLCKLMFREFRSEQDYHDSELYAMNRRYTQFIVDVVTEGVQSGEFRKDVSPSLVRHMIYGGIEHYAWNYMCGRGDLDIDRTADQVTDILWDGIATRHITTGGGLQRETQRLSEIVERIERALPRRARK
jgi:AcrR family transcriptional regulator